MEGTKQNYFNCLETETKTKTKMTIIKSKTSMQRSTVFSRIQFKMNSIILLTLSVLAVVLPAYAQFGIPFDASDCTGGRLIDPFLIQALKSKYPKKFNSKLDYAKDLALDAKCRLQTAKLFARHMKNLNSANCDLQNLMYQAQQPGLLQPVVLPDQSALFAQQQQQQQQQQQLVNYQIPIDASRLTITPQVESQVSLLSQMADPRYQQPTIQLTGVQRYENPTPQEYSPQCTKPECPCNCEECEGGPIPNALSSVVSTFLGVLKSILK